MVDYFIEAIKLIALDHIAVAGNSLDQASDHIASSLGVKLQKGGYHERFGTHNRLLGLTDGLYLEAIAIKSKTKKPRYPRWFNLDNFEGNARIINWICRSTNINSDLMNLFYEGTEIVRIKRDQLEWLMALPRDGILPFGGAAPALLQWKTTPPTGKLAPSGCSLKHLTIFHPEAKKIENKMQILNDPRVSYEVHKRVHFFAEFATPHGIRVLE